ncbi:MAG: hypothetical protein HW412_148 [Bacteroidetes bacterium]|nr:hypothetical protein [Bacteroidota bacterium]
MIDKPLADRLKSKSVRDSIISSIARDFNLTPLLAEAYLSQIREYFLQHTDIDLASGQMRYLAVNENEPAGKPIALCKKTSIKVTLHKPEEDLDVYKKSGLHGLRHHKILRIANEAIDQGGVLSCEDLAFILTSKEHVLRQRLSLAARLSSTCL